MKRSIVLAASLLFACRLAASESAVSGDRSFLCVAKKATGFAYEGGQYVQASFDVKDATYLFSPRDFSDSKLTPNMILYGAGTNAYTWMVSRTGTEHVAWCREFSSPTRLECEDKIGPLSMRLFVDRLIYLRWYLFMSPTDTPALEMGDCSRISLQR
jgi:hypothetical protein